MGEPFRFRPRIAKVMSRQATQAVAGPDHAGLDDNALVDLLTRGEPDALGELYQRHGTACYRLARHVTANTALAEDAVQEAFTSMWRNPAAYVSTRGSSVRSWLLGMTHNKAVDSVRRETSQQRRQHAHAAQRALDPPQGDDPAALTWERMRAAEVRAAVSELPDAQREALALAYFGGYTQSEIAELINVPLGTVKTRTFAAMRRLRLRLAPFDGLPGEEAP